jgi:hypothetical protein
MAKNIRYEFKKTLFDIRIDGKNITIETKLK